jgi:hypothetical protein
LLASSEVTESHRRPVIDSCQVGLDRRQHGMVVDTGGGGRHLRDQVGCVVLAGLGQMHAVTDPAGIALGFVARLNVVGRANDLGRWRLFVARAPAQYRSRRIVAAVLLLNPDLPQRLDGRQFPELGRTGTLVDRLKQAIARVPDDLNQRLSLSLRLG